MERLLDYFDGAFEFNGDRYLFGQVNVDVELPWIFRKNEERVNSNSFAGKGCTVCTLHCL